VILKVQTEDEHEVIIDLKLKFKLSIADYREIKSIKGISGVNMTLKQKRVFG